MDDADAIVCVFFLRRYGSCLVFFSPAMIWRMSMLWRLFFYDALEAFLFFFLSPAMDNVDAMVFYFDDAMEAVLFCFLSPAMDNVDAVVFHFDDAMEAVLFFFSRRVLACSFACTLRFAAVVVGQEPKMSLLWGNYSLPIYFSAL